jgi:putative endonuclease
MSAPRRQSTRARGQQSEALARAFLEAQGYRTVASNFRVAGGEIDLIAFEGAVLCFIEVRSRTDTELGEPLETIDARKIRRITVAAREFIGRLPRPWPEMRFDAVGIVLEDPPRIELVRDAFEAIG